MSEARATKIVKHLSALWAAPSTYRIGETTEESLLRVSVPYVAGEIAAALAERDAAQRAFATWDSALAAGRATDDADGWPDRKMVPLVEALRQRGIVTLQSCAGHAGTDDGCLWVDARTVSAASVYVLDIEPFTYIRRALTPEPRWEFGWVPNRVDAAIACLTAIRAAGATEHRAGMEEAQRLAVEIVKRITGRIPLVDDGDHKYAVSVIAAALGSETSASDGPDVQRKIARLADIARAARPYVEQYEPIDTADMEARRDLLERIRRETDGVR